PSGVPHAVRRTQLRSSISYVFFLFNDSATTEISTLSLHDALPIFADDGRGIDGADLGRVFDPFFTTARARGGTGLGLHIVHNLVDRKSHTSELQSRRDLVCRLLLEKKKRILCAYICGHK